MQAFVYFCPGSVVFLFEVNFYRTIVSEYWSLIAGSEDHCLCGGQDMENVLVHMEILCGVYMIWFRLSVMFVESS